MDRYAVAADFFQSVQVSVDFGRFPLGVSKNSVGRRTFRLKPLNTLPWTEHQRPETELEGHTVPMSFTNLLFLQIDLRLRGWEHPYSFPNCPVLFQANSLWA